jgi:hypothetical protein
MTVRAPTILLISPMRTSSCSNFCVSKHIRMMPKPLQMRAPTSGPLARSVCPVASNPVGDLVHAALEILPAVPFLFSGKSPQPRPEVAGLGAHALMFLEYGEDCKALYLTYKSKPPPVSEWQARHR